MQLIPIKNSFPTDTLSVGLEKLFLIQKGRTIDPDGLNIIILFYYMLIFNLHCQLVLRVSDITKICYIKTRPYVKFSLYLKKAGLASRISYSFKKSSYVVSDSTFIFSILYVKPIRSLLF